MNHPADEVLALYAGSELGLWGRFRISGHLHRCERCNRHIEEFRELRGILEAERYELPESTDWLALAAEMRANIHLGIAAGQCVREPVHEPVRMPWRTPAFALPVLLVVVAGWIVQSLPPAFKPVPATGASPVTVLDGGPSGIGVEQDGRGFRLLNPQAQNVVFSVRGDSVRSRYVDAETGQVTISHVYAD